MSQSFLEDEYLKNKTKLLKLTEALTKISSGMGHDLFGTTSLDREDMQDIATAVLAKVKEGE